MRLPCRDSPHPYVVKGVVQGVRKSLCFEKTGGQERFRLTISGPVGKNLAQGGEVPGFAIKCPGIVVSYVVLGEGPYSPLVVREQAGEVLYEAGFERRIDKTLE